MQKKSYISLSQAAKLCPSRPHVSAVWRWCRRGLKARSGETVWLKHIRAGGRIYTTPNWLYQFFSAVAEADATYFENRKPAKYTRRKKRRNSSKRSLAIKRAEKELEKIGI